jgi:hypothetical protein
MVQDYSVILDPIYVHKKESDRPLRPNAAQGR